MPRTSETQTAQQPQKDKGKSPALSTKTSQLLQRSQALKAAAAPAKDAAKPKSVVTIEPVTATKAKQETTPIKGKSKKEVSFGQNFAEQTSFDKKGKKIVREMLPITPTQEEGESLSRKIRRMSTHAIVKSDVRKARQAAIADRASKKPITEATKSLISKDDFVNQIKETKNTFIDIPAHFSFTEVLQVLDVLITQKVTTLCINNNRNLATLLTTQHFAKQFFDKLTMLLDQNNNIVNLELRNINLQGLQSYFPDAMKSLATTSLESLDISDNHLGRNLSDFPTVKKGFQELARGKNFKFINLSGNMLQTRGAIAAIKCLTSYKSFTIDLSNNSVVRDINEHYEDETKGDDTDLYSVVRDFYLRAQKCNVILDQNREITDRTYTEFLNQARVFKEQPASNTQLNLIIAFVHYICEKRRKISELFTEKSEEKQDKGLYLLLQELNEKPDNFENLQILLESLRNTLKPLASKSKPTYKIAIKHIQDLQFVMDIFCEALKCGYSGKINYASILIQPLNLTKRLTEELRDVENSLLQRPPNLVL